ncbi:MAG: SDR family oxidoreductase [Gammaproteobacteria bacterium]
MPPAALVTGASRGIGRAIAARLAGMGYRLLLLARDRNALDETARECRLSGVEVQTSAGDLADEAYVRAAVRTATDAFGAVDVLINNAGAARREAVQDADLAAWRGVMALNFDAVLNLTRQVLPGMIERRSGAVINVSSISGRSTNAGGGVYCASKHALNGLAGCLYEDVRDYGIKVSTIMPGYVDTALTEGLDLVAGNMIRPEDVADSVAYVLSASANCCPTEIVLRPQRRP